MDPREELMALRRLAELEARARPSAVSQDTYDPTEGMAGWQKLAAGAGKAISDTGRGLGQLLGLVSQDEIDAAKKRDSYLMDTGAGLAGNILGNVGMTLLPGGVGMGAAKALSAAPTVAQGVSALSRGYLMPQTVMGALAGGAAQGFVQPVASDESRFANTTLGAVGGAAVPGIAALGKTAKSLVAPFSESGREKLAGRALERFAADPGVLTKPSEVLVPGSLPTLAENTQDIGLAQLQRSLRNNPDANIPITERMAQNQTARENALRDIAGEPGKRDFFAADREAAAQNLYKQAFGESPKLTPWVKGQISQLRERPAFQAALANAGEIAANEGLKLDPNNTVQVLHYTKLALDDAIGSSKGNLQRAIIDTKKKLVSLMESKDFAPSYREARVTFSEMSKPINQMDLGNTLLERLQPALSQFGATSRVTPQKYAEAVRNLDTTAQTATGFRGARAENILSPDQLLTVQNIAKDLGRSANAQELGMAKGSPTAQNLVSQDILRQVLGPLGLPQTFADTALAENLLRPVSFAYKPAEKRVLGLLGDAVLDPQEAKRLLELARKNGKLSELEKLLPYTSRLGAVGALEFQ